MNAATKKQMGVDHAQWRAEHVRWKAKSEKWLDVCESMLTELKQLENELCDYIEAIQLHQESIDGLECGCDRHDRVMAIESGPVRPLQDELEKHHRDQAELHVREHAVHHSLEARYRRILAMLPEMANSAGQHAEPGRSTRTRCAP